MWKHLFAGIIVAFALCTNLYARPALPEQVDLPQPDGSRISARQLGDEFQHWTETKSGYTIVRNPQTKYWEYAEQDAAGRLKASGYRALPKGLVPAHLPRGLKPPRNVVREQYQQKFLKKAYQERRSKSSSPSFASSSSLPPRSPAIDDWTPLAVAGERKVLLVLVNFSDRSLLTTAAEWEPAVFSSAPENKSVARYYAENSFASLQIAPAAHSQTENPPGVVTVTIAAAHPDSDETLATEINVLNQALAEAAAVVNFRAFDIDGNGMLEPSELAIYFIYAGYEASESRRIPSVWAHNWGGDGVTAGGVTVSNWAMNGELNAAELQLPIGAMVHELGHALCGLPDLYDTSYTNAGMGIFSLMAAGSFGADTGEDVGTTPTALGLWSREYLGWSIPPDPGREGLLSLNPPLDTQESGFKLKAPGRESEYFLLENRTPSGWDLGAKYALGPLWQGGLLITHIDLTAGTAGSNDINNFAASGGRQGVLPVQAGTTSCNMLFDSDCWGKATTLFFAGNNSAWTPVTAPDSNYYDGTPTDFSLTAISSPGDPMTALWSTTPIPPLAVVDDFESGTLGKLPWLTSGNANWAVIASGYNGGYAAEAPISLNDFQFATLQTTVVTGGGTLSFRYKVDSEARYDFLTFFIDGVEKGRWSGAVNWSRFVYPLTAGSHTLVWKYTKDGSDAAGLDSAWMDDLSFPARYDLSVLRMGSGSVTPDLGTLTWTESTASATYDIGTIVTLTAIADPGSIFTGWGGACSGRHSCVVTMAAVQEVTATFALNLPRHLRPGRHAEPDNHPRPGSDSTSLQRSGRPDLRAPGAQR